MPAASVVGQCPHWCACDHSFGARASDFYHASETAPVAISQLAPDRLDVQIAQYLPDDPGEPPWSPAVEITVPAGGRYRLISLSPDEALELAEVLARAAGMLGAPGHLPAQA
jgi:hypothetical protein